MMSYLSRDAIADVPHMDPDHVEHVDPVHEYGDPLVIAMVSSSLSLSLSYLCRVSSWQLTSLNTSQNNRERRERD